MSTKPASIAQLLDYSGSMADKSTDTINTNLQLLQTDVNTFITIMQNSGDLANQLGQVGLVKFSTTASVLYALTNLDAAGTTRQAAITAVNSLTPYNMTNISDAIAKGHSMLASVDTSTYNRAMILFSDGMWNEGGDPTVGLPTDIPIYTIGYGNASELSYLQTIATNTGGQYNVTGNPATLQTYYNDIIQSTQVAATVANASDDIQSYGYFPTTAVISQGSAFGLFNATWADSGLNYTATTPGPTQIQVILSDPSGMVVTPDSVDAPNGGGYAVLTVNNPTPGTWTVALRPNALPSGANTIGTALGAFEPADNINVNLEAQAVNSPLHVKAQVTDEGEALNELSWSVHSKHPLHTHDELLERHERAVRKILHENDFHEDTHQETAALRILNRQRPELNLFRQVHQPASTQQSGEGEYQITVQDHKKGAENVVYAVVKGCSPVSGKNFQRTRVLTVIP